MADPRVCVVLLNWNGRADTLACLDSLRASTYTPLDIIVVDQGSEDGLVEVLRQREPGIEIIVNERNLGFAGGNNQGIQRGLDRRADYVLLLNNDTVIDQDCIAELVRAAEANPAAGTLGPKIYHYGEPKRFWSCGGVVDYGENVVKMRGYGQVDRGQFDTPATVDFISGCAVIARRQAIEAAGLLDEVFFPGYYEDADWGLRVGAAGYDNLMVPSASVWHKVSRSTGGDYNPTSKYLMGHHAILFLKRYARWHQWLHWFVFAVLSLPFLYIVRALQGEGQSVWAKARGTWDGLRGARVFGEAFQQPGQGDNKPWRMRRSRNVREVS